MTTTLDKLDTINDSLNDIKTAVIAKGQTPSGDITTYATAISNIPQQAAVIDSLSITPSTSAQTITAPSGTDGYSPVNVAAVTASIDSNISAGNIVSGVSILGVNGSATVLNGETRSVSITSTAGNTFTPSSGKNGITSITVTPNNEARSVTPSTSAQTLNVNSGYSGNGTISVGAVTASIDANILPENIKKDVVILNTTGTYEGSGGGGGKYQLLESVYSDNNTFVGKVVGFFTYANDIEYAVVAADPNNYYAWNKQWMSATGSVTNLPEYGVNTNLWESKNTATSNTQKILDFCSAYNLSSSACSWCRSISFVIDGVTYYGQLPNAQEVIDLMKHWSSFFGSTRYLTWSSDQFNTSKAWFYKNTGEILSVSKDTSSGVSVQPVFEIPNS